MQFKIVFALAFATLAAAGALPAGANTNPSLASQDTKSTSTNIAPPFPSKDSISGSQCPSGHLRCCKSAESPSAADVAPHLPSGIPASSLSGFVGLTCKALPDGAEPKDCTLAPVCCTDNSHGDTISLGCNKVDLSS